MVLTTKKEAKVILARVLSLVLAVCLMFGMISVPKANAASTSIACSGCDVDRDGYHFAYVTANSLNVRSGSGTNYSKIGSLKLGDVVYYKITKNNFAQISTVGLKKSWEEGWVSLTYLEPVKRIYDPTEKYNTSSTSLKVKTTANVNVRQAPGTIYKAIATINKGVIVEMFASSGNWRYCKKNSTYGWIHKDYLTR